MLLPCPVTPPASAPEGLKPCRSECMYSDTSSSSVFSAVRSTNGLRLLQGPTAGWNGVARACGPRRLVQCAPDTPLDPTRSPSPGRSLIDSTHRPKSLSRSVWRPPRVAPPVRAAILVPDAGRVHKRAAAPVIGALWPPVAPRGAGGAHRGVFANFGSCACGPWRAGAPECHRQVSNRAGAWGLNPFRSLRVALLRARHSMLLMNSRAQPPCPTTLPPTCAPHEHQQ